MRQEDGLVGDSLLSICCSMSARCSAQYAQAAFRSLLLKLG